MKLALSFQCASERVHSSVWRLFERFCLSVCPVLRILKLTHQTAALTRTAYVAARVYEGRTHFFVQVLSRRIFQQMPRHVFKLNYHLTGNYLANGSSEI